MSFFKSGYEMIGEFLSYDQVTSILNEVEAVETPPKAGGIRNAEKKFSTIRELAYSEQLISEAKKYLSDSVGLVRAILFDKTEENNWLATWHQDKTVAVSKRFSKNEWGPWSMKDGVPHVQPPVEVLNHMVTIRIHLDDTSQKNGCLKVLPKSQELGVLDNGSIQEYVLNHSSVMCEGLKGSALIMHPCILHASSKASNPSKRRVLHLEYSSFKLPPGIAWA